MLPIKINVGAVTDRWREFYAATNAAQPFAQRKRKMADGTVKIDYVPKKVLDDGVLSTGLQLILLYATAYGQAIANGFDAEQPFLSISGPTLGKLSGVSARATRTRMNKLKGCGFAITKFCGRTHNYKVWIMPGFLFPELLQADNPLRKITPNTPAFTPNWNRLPPKVLETTGNKEKEITHVDICGVAVQQSVLPAGEDACNTFTGNTGPQQAGNFEEEAPQPAVAAKKQATGAGAAAAVKKPAVNPVFLFYIEHFWSYAKQVLYPGEDFDETHDKLAKRAIWTGVYGSFKVAEWSEKEWEKYHDNAILRLDLAATYYRNHQDKHPPKPYAEWVHGTGYFDMENTRGFVATSAWLTKHQTWKQQHKVNDALRRARTDFRLYKQGKARKRLQEKSPLELFHFHEVKFRQLGHDALQKFYKQHAINQ